MHFQIRISTHGKLPSIAVELDVSLRTVQFRRSSLMEKLEVETRAELVKLMALVSNDQRDASGSDQYAQQSS